MSTDPETTIHKKLSHLTSVQIDDLLDKYYNGSERVAELIETFQIDVKPGKLVSLFPPTIHLDSYCPFCTSQNLVSEAKRRTGYSWIPKERYCPNCGHWVDGYCNCEKCSNTRQVEKNKEETSKLDIEKRKREIISNECACRDIVYPTLEEISFRDALYLVALTRQYLSEDLISVDPFSAKGPPLAPTFEFTNTIVQHLYGKGFIEISAESGSIAFDFDDDVTMTVGYFPTRVVWSILPRLNVEEKAKYLRNMELFIKNEKWSGAWNNCADREWNRVAKYECFEHFQYLLRERDFEISKFGEKTHAVFEMLLLNFSVSQIFNLSWQTVRDITDYSVRKSIPKYHAKNLFIGALQRKADRYIAEKWNLKSVGRDYNLPRTVVSSTLFDVFLELGDEALRSVPPDIS